jgi:adenine deaminase
MVFAAGRLVARDGEPTGEWVSPDADSSSVRGSVDVDLAQLDLDIPAAGHKIRVIGALPDRVVTDQLIEAPKIVDGMAVADPGRDLLKIAVIERHRGTGDFGLGFVRGLGLDRGALASTVGHDAHNLIVAGCDDASMLTAIRATVELEGGLVVAAGEDVLASVPLPVGGLMSDQPVEFVRNQMDLLIDAARELGSRLHDPFMTLSFLALEVIPRLKLTDQGLVDVEAFDFVPLFVD